MLFGRSATTLPTPSQALPGRQEPGFRVPERHAVLGTPIAGPVPHGMAEAFFGMGCFWGAERRFWQLAGVYSTAVGYQGGQTPNPTYDETCTGLTGHTEAVRVVYDPARGLVRRPAQGVLGDARPHPGVPPRQRHRLAVPVSPLLDERGPAKGSRGVPRGLPSGADEGRAAVITTELLPAPEFYYAEEPAPAIPCKGAERLRLPRQHRRPLPHPNRNVEVCWGYSPSKLSRCGGSPEVVGIGRVSHDPVGRPGEHRDQGCQDHEQRQRPEQHQRH